MQTDSGMSPWEKQKLRQQDPERCERARQKKLKSIQKARAKLKAKIESPEYREEMRRKARELMQRRIEKAREKAATPGKRKPTRGVKGRTPTAEEKRHLKAVGQMPCIACEMHGKHSPETSPHHILGRTKPDAHRYVIPLCRWHHQYAAPEEIRKKYPWLVPVHADGKVGGKAAFAKLNMAEEYLLEVVFKKTEDF